MDNISLINIADKNVIIYHLSLVFLLKIVVFILGFLTIKMGYHLIRDGVTGKFSFKTDFQGVNGALKSTSPGLLFIVLGILLIGYAMFVKKGIDLDLTESKPTHQKNRDENIGGKPNIGKFHGTVSIEDSIKHYKDHE